MKYEVLVFDNFRSGICGAWSFDTFEGECFLHTAYSCCGQFDKRQQNSNFISGYTCNKCWSTRNECPCGRKNPLPDELIPNEPSPQSSITKIVNRQETLKPTFEGFATEMMMKICF